MPSSKCPTKARGPGPRWPRPKAGINVDYLLISPVMAVSVSFDYIFPSKFVSSARVPVRAAVRIVSRPLPRRTAPRRYHVIDTGTYTYLITFHTHARPHTCTAPCTFHVQFSGVDAISVTKSAPLYICRHHVTFAIPWVKNRPGGEGATVRARVCVCNRLLASTHRTAVNS